MTGVSTHLSPFGSSRIAIGPLDEVERLTHPLVHLRHRHHVLRLIFHAPSSIGALTTHATGQDRQRLHLQVLTELEILIVAQSHRLVISPCVLQAPALFLRANRGLPAIGIPEAVTAAMNNTTSGETHEFRVQVGQCLSQVLTQTVALISILRHQRYHVDIKVTCVKYKYLEHCFQAIRFRRQCSVILLPVLRCRCQDSISKEFGILPPSLRFNERHADILGIAPDIAQESGEVISGTSLHRDAVETVVLQTEPFPARIVVILLDALRMQAHISWIVGMNAVVLTHVERAETVPWPHLAPGRASPPSVAFGRAELEGAVLDQFGIKSAVSSTADILKEDADQFVTDDLAACRSSHRLLGIQPKGCCRKCSKDSCTFHISLLLYGFRPQSYAFPEKYALRTVSGSFEFVTFSPLVTVKK